MNRKVHFFMLLLFSLGACSGAKELSGQKVQPGQLAGVWRLEQIDGEKLVAGVAVPELEFFPVEKRFGGFGGCNRINGRCEFGEDSIRFSRILATKMACPDLPLENRFLSLLRESSWGYRITGDTLCLTRQPGSLVFRKGD